MQCHNNHNVWSNTSAGMATNEVIDQEDIWHLDVDELAEHLLEQGFSDEAVSILKGMSLYVKLPDYSLKI